MLASLYLRVRAGAARGAVVFDTPDFAQKVHPKPISAMSSAAASAAAAAGAAAAAAGYRRSPPRMTPRTTALIVVWLAAECHGYDPAASPVPGGPCESWCTEPCTVLNGAVEMECSGCSGAQFLCRPGEAGYPGATDESPAADAPTRAYSISTSGGASRAAPAAQLAMSDGGTAAAVHGIEFEDDVNSSCLPYLRTIGDGDRTVHLCPVLNGIWTSFLDPLRWRAYSSPLDEADATRVVEGMRRYDAVGLGSWIGEDFDERVLSALEAHRRATKANETAAAVPLAHSIIVERGHEVEQGLELLQARLGMAALRWVQVR